MTEPPDDAFAARLLAWFDHHGRHDLPWQHPRSPYRVWLSEVMLQQTQVAVVIGYFQRFVERFGNIAALAAAPADDVLALWSGLGYYSRARNLHAAAQRVVAGHGGELPDSMDALLALPGIGRSTAAAILSQAFGQREAILDGNVKRVMARQTGEAAWPGLPKVQARLWAHAETLLPQARMADYTQALMDLGATVCTPRRPACLLCPVQSSCTAFQTGQTASIPAPKPRRAIPDRHHHWLLLRDNQGRILLERRPPSGIWGGLFALPESTELAELAARHQLVLAELKSGEQVEHGFTHFNLRAQVWNATRTSAPPQLHENGVQRWTHLADIHELGVPAPLRRLLARLGSTRP